MGGGVKYFIFKSILTFTISLNEPTAKQCLCIVTIPMVYKPQETDYLHHLYHLYDSEGSESEGEEERERRERLVRLHSKLQSVLTSDHIQWHT